jgi:4'-phosphopantetheinyl transferase
MALELSRTRDMRAAHRVALADGSVHVLRADLRLVSDDVLGWLQASERERAARFARERDGLLWARSRATLRGLLGRYLEIEPQAIEFRLGKHGKPALIGPAMSFNLSHSGPLALYAFCSAGPVGVDVQAPRARPINAAALAERAFGAAEARRLERIEPAQREREFLRAWVRHEAALKCRGTGIWRGSRPRAAVASGGSAPWVIELELGTSATAALAVHERPRHVRCFTLD